MFGGVTSNIQTDIYKQMTFQCEPNVTALHWHNWNLIACSDGELRSNIAKQLNSDLLATTEITKTHSPKKYVTGCQS